MLTMTVPQCYPHLINHFTTNVIEMGYYFESLTIVSSNTPLSKGDTFQDPQRMPETVDSTKSYIYYVFFLYLHTYDKV